MRTRVLPFLIAATWAIPARGQPAPEAADPAPPSDEIVEVDVEGPPPLEVEGETAEGETAEGEGGTETPEVINVSVFGKSTTRRVTGSAHRIDEKELQRFEDDNIHRTLTRVPGVYVRGEDGYGLRPNIGIRGGSSDRSKKVTLLENGVLLGPAPYSAPAAYYFPLLTRMSAVEVFKGPSALRHGPNTIGGAINLVTRPIPWRHRLGADLAFGAEKYGKLHGYYGYGADNWGVLFEGVGLRSDGFKQLDSPVGGDTGFEKMEFMVRGRVNTDPGKPLYNEVSIKLGYAHEDSRETYLGLTDADFRANPLRRYAASALDRMKWDRFQVELNHAFSYRNEVRFFTTAYRHDFHRAWFKLNRLEGAPPIELVLHDPTGSRAVLLDMIRGADSGPFDPALLIGTNDRTFVSQGIQTNAMVKIPRLWLIDQELQLGVRIHHDSIDRMHTEDSFVMRGGRPRSDGRPRQVVVDNTGSTVAFATYAIDEIEIWRFLLTPGVRFEYVTTIFENADGVGVESRQHAILPGVGLLYQIIDEIAVLGGVHMGYSPVAPQDPGINPLTGQVNEIEPEVAINYEAGARLSTEWANADVIGFFSDYSNLSGECTFSQGCAVNDLDQQFNAGEAIIYGVEASAETEIQTPIDLTFPLRVAYTYTETEFQTAFQSDNPAFADVEVGDEMPYVPRHQFAAILGLASQRWGSLTFGATFVDEMRETAGSGEIPEGGATDPYLVFDASASFPVTEELSIYGKAENLLDNAYIVSRRPYGARPGRPRFIYGGVKVLIDRP